MDNGKLELNLYTIIGKLTVENHALRAHLGQMQKELAAMTAERDGALRAVETIYADNEALRAQVNGGAVEFDDGARMGVS